MGTGGRNEAGGTSGAPPTRADLQGSWYELATAPDGGTAISPRRLRFDGDTYYLVSNTAATYCAEVGTFQLGGTAITYQPDQVTGFGACATTGVRSEDVLWNDVDISLGAAGTTRTFRRARVVPKVFATVEAHDGALAGDATLPGANAIEKADGICNRSIAKPDGASYRAMLVDGANRSALPSKDWVLAPNTVYFQADGVLNVFTANSIGLSNPDANHPIISGYDIQYAWTGLGFDFAGHDTCKGWTSSSGSAIGGGADLSQAGSTFEFGGGSSCSRVHGFVCVTAPIAPPGGLAGGTGGAPAIDPDLLGAWSSPPQPPAGGSGAALTTGHRLRFDQQTYYLVEDGVSRYCGETGSYEVVPPSIHFVPARVEGLGDCVMESERIESLTKAGSDIVLTGGAGALRYNRAADVPKLFATFETHNGNFAGDTSLLGATVLEKADSFCNQSSAKPDGRRYKAVLTDGTQRTAATPDTWILKPDTTYFAADGTREIFPTNAGATATAGISRGSIIRYDQYPYMWTGLDGSFAASKDTCKGWTSTDSQDNGTMTDVSMSALAPAVLGMCPVLLHGLVCVSE